MHRRSVSSDPQRHGLAPPAFALSAIPNQSGKTVLIFCGTNTANLPLAASICTRLALAGAAVFLCCREKQAGIQHIITLRERVPGAQANLIVFDAADARQAGQTCAMIVERLERVDLVVAVGMEKVEVLQMAMARLIPVLSKLGGEGARVVLVSEGTGSDVEFDGMRLSPPEATCLVMAGLNDRFATKGVHANAVIQKRESNAISRFLFGLDDDQRSLAALYAATAADVGGKCIVPFGAVSDSFPVDKAIADLLWDWCERQTCE
ncbi:hypothetical protein BC830DRAFT_1163245 [Chytriomyces sp. MP71]|nr:hypothetical protein BC830DRAFT_1163245 [Chytriomyces sp. MP71]